MSRNYGNRNIPRNSLLKAYLQKIKKLVIDENNEMVYIDNFDHVIEDIFGVKHFARRLNQCYDDRDTLAVLNTLGTKILNDILTTPSLYQAFAELVALDHRLVQIRKRIRKDEKKGKKKNKDLLKEYEYLTDLYKKARKRIRDRFGIKSGKKSYKRKYSALSNMVKNNYDYDDDDDFSSVLYSSDLDDDDDDDYRNTSELDDIANLLNGKRSRRRGYDYEEDYDDDDDDYDDDVEDTKSSSKIDKLASVVSGLANTVQYMLNADYRRDEKLASYKPHNHMGRPVVPMTPIQPEPIRNQVSSQMGTSIQPDLTPVYNAIDMLTRNQGIMMETQNQIIHTINEMDSYLRELDVEDDEDDDYNSIDNGIISQIDKYEDIAAEAPTVTRPVSRPRPAQQPSPKREELIDQINHSADTAEGENVNQ